MKKEFNFKKSKQVGDRFKNKETKVSVTVRLDADILLWLRERAEQQGVPYQTLINSFLKQGMNNSVLTEERVRSIVKEELTKIAS